MAKDDGTAPRRVTDITLRPRQPGAIDRFIGRRIEIERRACGITAAALAERLGFSVTQLRKYEVGTSRIPAATLIAIGQIVGVPITRFVPETAFAPEAALAPEIALAPGDIPRTSLRLDADVMRSLLDLAKALDAARSRPR